MRLMHLRPFIPAGDDYSLSRQFFADLGFQENWANDELCELQRDDAIFYLQNFANLELQQNLMLQVAVDNLDVFHGHMIESGILDRYPMVRINGPKKFAWGLREVQVLDPAGVLWHFV